MTMKKMVEPILFLAVCIATVLSYLVALPIYAELVVILLAAALPGWLTIGGGQAKWVFLRRIPHYRRFCVILFVVFCIINPISFLPIVQPANGAFTLYLMLVSMINALIYLIYLFAPQSIPLSDAPTEE